MICYVAEAITDLSLTHLSNLPLQTLNLRTITGAQQSLLWRCWSYLIYLTYHCKLLIFLFCCRTARASKKDKQDQKTLVENSSSQAVEYSSSSYSSAEQEQDQKQTIRRIPGVTDPLPSSDRMDTQEGKKSIEATTRSDII